VVCAVCGETSQDVEFCDNCNADLEQPGADLPGTSCPLPRQRVELTPEQRGSLRRPEASIKLAGARQHWRIHWIGQPHLPRWLPEIRVREKTRLPCLPPCRVVEEDTGAWVMAKAGAADFVPWRLPPTDNGETSDALADLDRLVTAMTSLC